MVPFVQNKTQKTHRPDLAGKKTTTKATMIANDPSGIYRRPKPDNNRPNTIRRRETETHRCKRQVTSTTNGPMIVSAPVPHRNVGLPMAASHPTTIMTKNKRFLISQVFLSQL
jgi:hypothetical protein